jgi:pyruvate formate lyase activating enzyme
LFTKMIRGAASGNGRTANIFNIMRYSTQDGPGIRTTVFFKGCPLSCWWCHNPESQSFQPDLLYYEERCRHCGDCIAACPEHNTPEIDRTLRTGARCSRCGHCVDACVAEARRLAGHQTTVEDLIREIEKDLVFFEESGGGVTLSGGEPASQADAAIAVLDACRVRRIHTAIETCGFAPAETFFRVAIAADLVLFDLKAMDPEIHRHYTGVWNGRILSNLETLVAAGCPPVVRIPVVPGVNDSDDEARRFAEYLSALRIPAVELLPFHRIGAEKYRRLGMPYRAADMPEPTAAAMSHFRDTLAHAGLHVLVGEPA